MKSLVCISKVPDTTTKVTFTDNNTKFNEENVQYIVNPLDEWYSLVRALELKEAKGEGTVTVVNVGPADNEQTIRKALAIGADDAVRIDAEPTDGYFTAAQIAAHAKDKGYDLIWAGGESIDYNGFQVGGMLAELLGLPYVQNATSIDYDGSSATLVRNIEGGQETLSVNSPFVLSTQKGMAEARIPNMRGIMQAKKKPLEVMTPVEAENLTEINKFEHPPEKGEVKMVDPENVDELVELLQNEAKVL